MRIIKIGVEYYDYDNDKDEIFVDQGRFLNFNGIILAKFPVPDNIEVSKEDAEKIGRTFLDQLRKAPPEVIKTTLRKYYEISLTKQYWYHVFEDKYLKVNQVPNNEDVEFKETSLEDALNTNLENDADTLDLIDVFFDHEFNKLDCPPERKTNDIDDILGEISL